jgi:FkbM family methyltransferase
MKTLIRKFLKKKGYHVYASHQLPIGFNWMLDLERLSKPYIPNNIFDVGANEGQTAMSLARRFGKARIYCFEPISATFEKLLHNTVQYANVVCQHCALGSENKIVDLYPKAVSTHSSLLPQLNRPEFSAAPAEKIQIQTVDEFLGKNDIASLNLLKTDTEGFDLEVLDGATDALATARIDVIVTEVGFHKEDRQHTSFSETHKFLEGFGYDLYGFYDQNHEDGRLNYADALFVSTKLRRACPREFASTFIHHAQ